MVVRRGFWVMQKKYGRRPGLKAVDTGARRSAPTFGREAVLSYAEKGGGVRVFENDAERLVSKLLGIDPRVRRFQPQPFAVDLVEGRLLRTAEQRDVARRQYAGRPGPALYTPDFYAEFCSGRRLALEVKLDRYLGAEPDHERIELAKKVLTNYGHEFVRVVMPADLSHQLRSNITLLHHAALRADLRPDDAAVAQIDTLAAQGARTYGDFANGLGVSVNLMPMLVLHGVLAIDLISHRFERRSPMTAAYGSLDHLELMERLAR